MSIEHAPEGMDAVAALSPTANRRLLNYLQHVMRLHLETFSYAQACEHSPTLHLDAELVDPHIKRARLDFLAVA